MPLDPAHLDFAVLNPIASEILKRAGGQAGLAEFVTQMFRDEIDCVIDTIRTRRRKFADLDKNEKSYIGTRVENALRNFLKLPRGKLDLVLAGRDVDVKMTTTGGWMLPPEVVGSPAVLLSANEVKARCGFGLVVVRPEYLRPGANQDKKRSLAAASHVNIWWLLRDYPYPPNFWRTVDPDAVARIFAGQSGNARMITLFKEVQGRAISRKVVEEVGAQKDFMRRVRADGPRGTRGKLLAEGLVLLSGTYDVGLIQQLGLPDIGPSDFISYRLRDENDRQLAIGAGYMSVAGQKT